jgi:hypothetical protein
MQLYRCFISQSSEFYCRSIASQRVFIVVSVYFVMTQSGNFWIYICGVLLGAQKQRLRRDVRKKFVQINRLMVTVVQTPLVNSSQCKEGILTDVTETFHFIQWTWKHQSRLLDNSRAASAVFIHHSREFVAVPGLSIREPCYCRHTSISVNSEGLQII